MSMAVGRVTGAGAGVAAEAEVSVGTGGGVVVARAVGGSVGAGKVIVAEIISAFVSAGISDCSLQAANFKLMR
jgi:hypothetical protein